MLSEITWWHRNLKATDKNVLGPLLQERDADEDYLQSDRTYAWHMAIGRACRPCRFGEIGVRFGYGLASIARGSVDDYREPHALELYGWDAEKYVPGSMAIAKDNLKGLGTFHVQKIDTQELGDLGCPPLDLIHVDGDHSLDGAYRDMFLGWRALRKGGVMLVDDFDFIGDVREAVRKFANHLTLGYEVLPTFRGTALMVKE